MKKWIRFIFSDLGIFIFWFPLTILVVGSIMAVGKYEYCNEKYAGFSAASCFFSDKARY